MYSFFLDIFFVFCFLFYPIKTDSILYFSRYAFFWCICRWCWKVVLVPGRQEWINQIHYNPFSSGWSIRYVCRLHCFSQLPAHVSFVPVLFGDQQKTSCYWTWTNQVEFFCLSFSPYILSSYVISYKIYIVFNVISLNMLEWIFYYYVVSRAHVLLKKNIEIR